MMRAFDRAWNSQRLIMLRRHVKNFFFPVVIVQQELYSPLSGGMVVRLPKVPESCVSYSIGFREGFIDVHLSRVRMTDGFGLFETRTIESTGIHPKTFRAKSAAAGSPTPRIVQAIDSWKDQTSNLGNCGCSFRGLCDEHSQLNVRSARVQNNRSTRVPRWRWLNPLTSWANTGRLRPATGMSQ